VTRPACRAGNDGFDPHARRHTPVAQLERFNTTNVAIAGSSPAGRTKVLMRDSSIGLEHSAHTREVAESYSAPATNRCGRVAQLAQSMRLITARPAVRGCPRPPYAGVAQYESSSKVEQRPYKPKVESSSLSSRTILTNMIDVCKFLWQALFYEKKTVSPLQKESAHSKIFNPSRSEKCSCLVLRRLFTKLSEKPLFEK
jgi:hypothetical protein